MKTYCQDYLSINHTKINISQEIACCILILIEKYEESLNNFSQKYYAGFLVRTFNYYLKDKNYQIKSVEDLFINMEEITLNLFSKFIDILIYYSSFFLKHNKEEYAKLILSIGLDIINKSKYNSEGAISQKKISLANNIACTYIVKKNLNKAEIFFEKCKENLKSSLDKILVYNNYCIVQIKKIKYTKKSEVFSLIKNIKSSLEIIFSDINNTILNKYKIDLMNIENFNNNSINFNLNNSNNIIFNSKDELFCFLIYNYFKISKIFDSDNFNNNYLKSLIFIQKILGNNHLINIKMIRLGYSTNSEPMQSIYNQSILNQKLKFSQEDIDFQDCILSEKRQIEDIKQEEKQKVLFEIKHEIKEEIKQKPKKEQIKEIKGEIKLEIKSMIKKEIKEEKKKEEKNQEEEKKQENDKEPTIDEKNQNLINIKKENITEESKNNNSMNMNNSQPRKDSENNKDNSKEKLNEDNKKVPPFSVKKTWKGMFQVLTGKKLPGTQNKLGSLFSSLTKSNLNNANNINNNNNKNQEIKVQYNEYDEEMEKYLAETKTDNYFTFNKNYANNYPEDFIIFIIDDNNNEKNHWDKIAFEKSQKKEYQKKPVSLFVTSYFKSLLQKKSLYPELIDDILDYDILEKMNNLYTNKRKNELFINKEIERITHYNSMAKRLSIKNLSVFNINNNTENKNVLVHFDEDNDLSFESPQINKSANIETECYLDSDKYKIAFINDYENNKININITKTKHSKEKKDSIDDTSQFSGFKRQIAYSDLYFYFSKFYKKGNLGFCKTLRYLVNLNRFINRVLVQYVRLIKINNEPQLIFCKYPKGNLQKLCRRGRPEFTFLNERCTFVVCKYREKTEIIIYNLAFTSSLSIILSLDESSESVFFPPSKKQSNLSSKVSADFEYNTNFKIFSRFTSLFIKLQKIFQLRDKTIKTFSEYVEKYKSNIHKVSSTDSMINNDLWIIYLQQFEKEQDITDNNDNEKNKINNIINNSKNKKMEFQWNVELYTITKLKIKNGAYYTHKNIILSSRDFENVIGCDYSDIYTIIDEKDNYFCLFFLLGTIQKMKHLLIKMLNSSNYLTAFRLQKINPISFFRYKFVFKHIKRYFLCSLEFLVYSRDNHYLRIMIMESITNRCYSKVYIPFYSIKKDLDPKETQKILIEKYDVINNLYQDKNKLKKFLTNECKFLLTKNPSDDINALVLFENIEFLVERIKTFLSEENKQNLE